MFFLVEILARPFHFVTGLSVWPLGVPRCSFMMNLGAGGGGGWGRTDSSLAALGILPRGQHQVNFASVLSFAASLGLRLMLFACCFPRCFVCRFGSPPVHLDELHVASSFLLFSTWLGYRFALRAWSAGPDAAIINLCCPRYPGPKRFWLAFLDHSICLWFSRPFDVDSPSRVGVRTFGLAVPRCRQSASWFAMWLRSRSTLLPMIHVGHTLRLHPLLHDDQCVRGLSSFVLHSEFCPTWLPVPLRRFVLLDVVRL
ncbi:hypothetical protein R1flu_012819 [Riccia fluitans]|uniref:Cytochrome c biogenesis B n=1 Tax=Riccia fluitans TaxID=41844 RepID=A0ABD1ZF36_9MARC